MLKGEHFVPQSVDGQLLLVAAAGPQSPTSFCWLQYALFIPGSPGQLQSRGQGERNQEKAL